MKKIVSLLLCFLLFLGLTACGTNNTESNASSDLENSIQKLDVNCNVYGISGPTGMGLVSLMENDNKGETKIDYNFNIVTTNDEIVAKIINKEADIAAVATNLAATLYSRTNGGISVLAVNTLGVLNIIAKGEEITSIGDLKGKTVYTTGKGANPEYIIKNILEKNNLVIGTDVDLQFVSQPSELVTKVKTSEKAVVIAPQPVATSITVSDENAKIVLNINDEWNNVSENDLVMGCIIARNDFISENKEAVEVFLDEYKSSINFINKNVSDASLLCEKYKVISPAKVAEKAIPYCNIVFQSGKTMKKNLSVYLKFLFDNNPASVGGSLPDNNFYYGTT